MNKTTKRYQTGKLSALNITVLGVVLAFRILITFVPAFSVGNYVEIGIGFIGAALTGALFGPWYAMIVSVANDLITTSMQGYQFFIGFTLSAALGGLIYGYMLWRKEITWKRVFTTVLIITLVVNLGLNSLWIRIMYGQAWIAFMPARIAKNAVSLVLNTVILKLLFDNPTVKRMIEKYRF
ncbi:folate family ECF transporter S component [Fundicoccus culcitae]|uniref:Folate family ECF transporter S component n=1 Tax=Fundicoccus culcitae TaxID=2969821 RepID=A0ABY5P364_9LACT|nr:folate family ECF transporter S component [Fundicoccus culcitae]UUX33167.1 folate family ECF transporter S component [Fundicoccus culcitae]